MVNHANNGQSWGITFGILWIEHDLPNISLVMVDSLLLNMIIEIVIFPVIGMVDLSILMLNYQRIQRVS